MKTDKNKREINSKIISEQNSFEAGI